jgi:hypothetical protein
MQNTIGILPLEGLLDFSPLPLAGTTKWSGPGVRAFGYSQNKAYCPYNRCIFHIFSPISLHQM